MKIFDTITDIDKINLVNDDVSVGVFIDAFTDTDISNTDIIGISRYYYTIHSRQKQVSSLFNEITSLYQKLIDNGELVLADDEDIKDYVNNYIGIVLNNKFKNKWKTTYQILIKEQYNPLYNREYALNKTAENSEKTTYDTEVIDDGNVGSHNVITTDTSNNDNVFGFNSDIAVGDSTATENITETDVSDYEKNKTHNVRTKDGNDTTEHIISENTTLRGRDNKSASILIEDELSLRDVRQFYDIVCKDVDSVIALQIY